MATEELDASDSQDIDELIGDAPAPRFASSLPEDPVVARQELRDVERLLERLNGLTRGDSKLAQFVEALQHATDDGRACLVFSEFTDTVEYLRDALFPSYGAGVACYTGEGGQVFDEGRWRHVTKQEITERLAAGRIRVLVCSDAASEGLNLQTASALINYDLPWNPARVEQRIGRIDRIGQRASDLRIVNLVLADSVDERVYQVLGQRCDLFQSYVGAMQPVLSVARRMLLGVQRFSAADLNAEADRAAGDAMANAAFAASDDALPPGKPAGVTIEDLVQAHRMLRHGNRVETRLGSRSLVADRAALEAEPAAIPLSPFAADVRALGQDLREFGERVPLVIEVAEDGAFRVVVAAWARASGLEIVERAERLEALLGMWTGELVSEAQWAEAHSVAREAASAAVRGMAMRARGEEQTALRRQLEAAQQRLLRELARYLACAAEPDESFNAAFHRAMEHGGQVGALLVRAHGLVGYPEWPERLVVEARETAERLSANQRKSVLLGKPLEAAVRDPRWRAAATLEPLASDGGPRALDV